MDSTRSITISPDHETVWYDYRCLCPDDVLDIAGVASLDDEVLADILAEVAASLERDHIIDSIVDTRMLGLIGDLANETFSEPVDETALDYAEPGRVRREPAVAVEGDEVWFRYPALDGGLFEFLIGDFTPERRRELTARACIEAKGHDETLYLDEPVMSCATEIIEGRLHSGNRS